MRRLTLGGVPLHPALVHFPVTFWMLAPLLDLGYVLGWGAQLWRLSWILALAGVVSALPAIAAGALDALACRSVDAVQGLVWTHAGLVLSSWTLFALASLFCPPDNPGRTFLAGSLLHLAGAASLIAGAHAGGRLAHVHHLPSVGESAREATPMHS
ncbi:MAG TPA: DUF2231 domain-containing protein [Burkholderiaceae bacterium]|nr:DUF2231 domain-containing protein [Burkholderiaceae bacterium]